jgi:aspartyl protease family protein
MDAGSQPQFYSMLLVLALVLGSFILASRGRGREIWHAARWWIGIFGVAILGAAFWPDIQPRVMSVVDPSGGQRLNGQIIFRKSDDGHFYARAYVNSVPLTFAVDTGASTIALSKKSAAQIGFDPNRLDYDGVSNTANGIVKTADITLDSISIGGREFKQVSATVLDSDLDISLLGMSFLSRFGKLSIEGDRLILE